MISKTYTKESILFICEYVREQLINGNYDTAKVFVSNLEEKLKEGLLEERFFIASTIAKFYRKTNNYDKSGNYSRQAIHLSKDIHKEHIEMIIDTYLDYASLEREYGQLQAARIELAKLLAFLDSNDYQDSYAYGVIFSNRGKIALEDQNIESGLTQLEKGYTYYTRAVPKTHPIVLNVIETLCDIYIQAEQYNKALKLQQEVLAEYNKLEDKVFEIRTLLKIGEIYFFIDLKEARKIITKAIKWMDDTYKYKEEYLDIAKAVLMLAELDENMGNLPRSINYYKKALKELQQFYKDDHFMIVYVYSKIGTLSIKTFKLNQAKEYLKEGLSRSIQFPKIRQQFLYALGKIYSAEKAYDKALIAFQEFLQGLDQSGRKKSLAYGNALQSIAFNYLVQEKLEQAFQHYQEALTIYEGLSNCKEEKGFTLIRLAYCYENIQVKELKKAEEYYEKGFKLIEKVRNPELLEEASAGIIDFFKRNNNPKKRKIYEDKIVKLQTNREK